MIQAFRSVGTKVVAGVFVVLMLIFTLMSVDWNQLGKGNAAVGKINGQRVDTRVFQVAVQQAIQNRQQQSQVSLGPDDYADIRNQVWEQIVQRTILEDEYRRRGITVTDDEIVDALRTAPLQEFQRAPEFQTDSQFDYNKYQRWLGTSAAQPVIAQLESIYRDQIKQQKLLQAVTADIFLSDAALWERYRDQQEKVKIGLTAIEPRNVVPDSAVSVSAAEVEDYYRKHTDDFKRPRTAYLSYITLPRLPNAADTALARARADSARQEIVGGAPFADVARRESVDSVSAAHGGTLDKWARGAMDPAFDSAAFTLPLNTVSAPVRSRFGFHLIEITSRKGDSASGRHILIPIEVAGAHRDTLESRADSLEHLAVDKTAPASLDSAARALRLTVGQAMPVREGTRVQLGNVMVPDAASWAFGAQVGGTSSLIETPWAYYVFRLDSLHEEGIPKLAEIRPAVAAAAQNAKKRAQARRIGDAYVARLAQGMTMESAAKAMALPYREFDAFPRVSPPISDPVLVGAAFGLAPGERSGLLETNDGIYIIQSLGITRADSAEFTTKLNDLRQQLMMQARQDRVRAYLDALRQAATIVDRRNEVLRQQRGPEA